MKKTKGDSHANKQQDDTQAHISMKDKTLSENDPSSTLLAASEAQIEQFFSPTSSAPWRTFGIYLLPLMCRMRVDEEELRV